jgi:hypothetical protein
MNDPISERHDHEPTTHQPTDASAHRWHGRLMIACCIPMLVIAAALVATGVISVSFLVIAIACTAMMALMMLFMPGGGHRH